MCVAWLSLDFNSRRLPLKCPSKSEKEALDSPMPRTLPEGFPAGADE